MGKRHGRRWDHVCTKKALEDAAACTAPHGDYRKRKMCLGQALGCCQNSLKVRMQMRLTGRMWEQSSQEAIQGSPSRPFPGPHPPCRPFQFSSSLYINKASNCLFWQFLEKCYSCPPSLLLRKENALWFFSETQHPAFEQDDCLLADLFTCDKLGKLPW